MLESEGRQKYLGWDAAVAVFKDKPSTRKGTRAAARNVSYAACVKMHDGGSKPHRVRRMCMADLFNWHKCDW